ncbi:hypothetical protein SEA_KASHFLOW_94 [Mycobacterium phage KashFlow]|nr:hypothetical protein SEA_KASHFLOW_94 [Mycobacterium phage KashFlow]
MRTCTIPGCEKKHHARGFCVMHYGRWTRSSDEPRGNYRRSHRPDCKLEWCNGRFYAKDLCRFHHQRLLRGKAMDDPRGNVGIFDWAACGTPAQYRKHFRHGIPLCDACRKAESRRQKDRREKAKR